jgi:hypothetical protein
MTELVRTKSFRATVGVLALLAIMTGVVVLHGGVSAGASTPQTFGGDSSVWTGPSVSWAGMTIGAPPVSASVTSVPVDANGAAAATAAAWPVPTAKIGSIHLALVSGGPYATPQLSWVVMYESGAAPYQVNPVSGTPVVTAWVFVDAATGAVFTMFSSTVPQLADASSPVG